MLRLVEQVRQVSRYGSPLMLIGESGVGKDLIAHYFHTSGNRRDQRFMKIDCSGIPIDLFESEMFGHERGAFTGAIRQRIGRLEQADGGTVYLDQVPDLTLSAQAKLARVIQDRCFERVGGTDPVQLDIHLVSSSRVDPNKLIRSGLFREELYYRLNVVGIEIPPLRARRDDIPLLIRHFVHQFSETHHRTPPVIPDAIMRRFQAHDWPGNVRELINTVERILITLPDGDQHSAITLEMAQGIPSETVQEMIEAATERRLSLENLEEAYIRKILNETRGNKSAASRILGINRKTLLEKRKKYGID